MKAGSVLGNAQGWRNHLDRVMASKRPEKRAEPEQTLLRFLKMGYGQYVQRFQQSSKTPNKSNKCEIAHHDRICLWVIERFGCPQGFEPRYAKRNDNSERSATSTGPRRRAKLGGPPYLAPRVAKCCPMEGMGKILRLWTHLPDCAAKCICCHTSSTVSRELGKKPLKERELLRIRGIAHPLLRSN